MNFQIKQTAFAPMGAENKNKRTVEGDGPYGRQTVKKGKCSNHITNPTIGRTMVG